MVIWLICAYRIEMPDSSAHGAERSLRIRLATGADLPALVALLSQLHEDAPEDYDGMRTPYDAAFAAIASDTRQRLYVGEAGGEIAATATLIAVPNLTHGGRPYAILENIVVDAAQRSRGIGDAIVRHLVEEARRAGCYKVSLTSNLVRTEAHPFYERLGFRFEQKCYRIDL
jgi:GNAT superfamily N-acetyltransferase